MVSVLQEKHLPGHSLQSYFHWKQLKILMGNWHKKKLPYKMTTNISKHIKVGNFERNINENVNGNKVLSLRYKKYLF